MSGHFDDDQVVIVRTGAYGRRRCEHGTLLVFACELCAEERRTVQQPAASAPSADNRIQIGPLDV